MNATINGFLAFMGDEDNAIVDEHFEQADQAFTLGLSWMLEDEE